MLHAYPNLILWIAGHRHINTVTAQPYNPADFKDHPERSFWEVETASLRDFPQQLRTFEIRRNADNTISILTTDVDPAVMPVFRRRSRGDMPMGVARILPPRPPCLPSQFPCVQCRAGEAIEPRKCRRRLPGANGDRVKQGQA